MAWMRMRTSEVSRRHAEACSYSKCCNRLTEEFDGHQVAEMYWFPYVLEKTMNPKILAGQQSQYNSKAEIRFIATDNMVSHGGLLDISVGDGDSIYKIVIGLISFKCRMQVT